MFPRKVRLRSPTTPTFIFMRETRSQNSSGIDSIAYSSTFLDCQRRKGLMIDVCTVMFIVRAVSSSSFFVICQEDSTPYPECFVSGVSSLLPVRIMMRRTYSLSVERGISQETFTPDWESADHVFPSKTKKPGCRPTMARQTVWAALHRVRQVMYELTNHERRWNRRFGVKATESLCMEPRHTSAALLLFNSDTLLESAKPSQHVIMELQQRSDPRVFSSVISIRVKKRSRKALNMELLQAHSRKKEAPQLQLKTPLSCQWTRRGKVPLLKSLSPRHGQAVLELPWEQAS